MGRLRAILTLVIVVGLLAYGANEIITRVTTSWTSQDALRRAALAVGSARSALQEHWLESDVVALRRVLVDIADDDQMIAVAACAKAAAPLATTERYPASLSCRRVRGLAGLPEDGSADRTPVQVSSADGLPVSIIPIGEDTVNAGSLVLIHDVRLAEFRVAEIRSMVLAGFALLGLASLLFGLLSRRFLQQSWTRDIRLVLGGFTTATESRKLLADLRALAARVTAEGDARDEERAWTPARVKTLVRDTLEGAKVLILANREPVIHQRDASGTVRQMRPASGLVSALEPVIQACAGTWVAHGSGNADREHVDTNDRLQIHPEADPYTLRRVWLTPEQEQGYYYGFSNEGLWPLCHIAHRRPTFRSADFDMYREVNQRFVDAVCDEADGGDPVVLVQDYHFALAPMMLRKRMPSATVLAFFHIPWPNAERLGICPWRTELIEGLLGASIVGFHTQLHCNNFIEAVDTYVEARIDRERDAVVQQGRQTLVRPYPISVAWPQVWSQSAPAADECRRQLIERYGLRPDALIGVGVDRLDYTKGLEERFHAVERALERHPDMRGRLSFIQISAPSRTQIQWYKDLGNSVQREADRINERFGNANYRPIILMREHHEHDSIAQHYRAANIVYVSSVHDGMNLVAKEFVAARDDEQGVLMLSHFAGASRELTEALIVNPYDIDGAAAAMVRGLTMKPHEQRERMRSMRTQVRESNVFRWAGRLLLDAARDRRRVHLAERLERVPGLNVTQ
jgi:trehalose 6-phosphate synthase